MAIGKVGAGKKKKKFKKIPGVIHHVWAMRRTYTKGDRKPRGHLPYIITPSWASGGTPANRSYVSILLVTAGPRGRCGLCTGKKIMNFLLYI